MRDAEWEMVDRFGYGVIHFPDGREVFMQGDEAWEFDQYLELLSEQQRQEAMHEYEDVALVP